MYVMAISIYLSLNGYASTVSRPVVRRFVADTAECKELGLIETSKLLDKAEVVVATLRQKGTWLPGGSFTVKVSCEPRHFVRQTKDS